MQKLAIPINIALCFIFLFTSACSNSTKIPHRKITNKTSVVKSCLDPSKNYHQVATIKSRTSYLEKAYDFQPVISTKGVIKWDFNKDGKLDYIFIEKQHKKTLKKSQGSPRVRLVICKSQIDKNNVVRYQRMLPNFTLYESILPDFQAESYRIKHYKKELIFSRSYHEHNWGSDETINFYEYNLQKNDFILVEQNLISSSGDGYRNDTTENYNFRNGHYIKTRQCGEFVGPCKTGKDSGSFKVRTIKLSNSKNIFQSMVQKTNLY